jgi:predicted DCC family thiol-disulfide oxidoreductase YuxK
VGARYDVLYDGDCGLCSRTVGWLRRLDWRGCLRFVDFNAAWDELTDRYPGLNRDACVDAMHVVSPPGRITAGFDGFRTLAWVVPALWLVAPFLYVPGVPPIGRRVYQYVARHRPTTCVLPQQSGSRQ